MSVRPKKLGGLTAVVQLTSGSDSQLNVPGPSAPAGSVAQPPPAPEFSWSTWSNDGLGTGSGGYGGGGANDVPSWVAWSHSQAEIVSATVVAAEGAPHTA